MMLSFKRVCVLFIGCQYYMMMLSFKRVCVLFNGCEYYIAWIRQPEPRDVHDLCFVSARTIKGIIIMCVFVCKCVNVCICAPKSLGLSSPGLLCPRPFWHYGVLT